MEVEWGGGFWLLKETVSTPLWTATDPPVTWLLPAQPVH